MVAILAKILQETLESEGICVEVIKRHDRSGLVSTHRTTIMPLKSSAGDVVPVLYVLKGTQMPYRTVVRKGVEHVETL